MKVSILAVNTSEPCSKPAPIFKRVYDPPSKLFSDDYAMVENCVFDRDVEDIGMVYRLPLKNSTEELVLKETAILSKNFISTPNLVQRGLRPIYWSSVPALSTISILVFIFTAHLVKLFANESETNDYMAASSNQNEFAWIFQAN